MIYFTSDMHFNHRNILRLCNRPFENINEMNQNLINNWNRTVNKNDEVYILGDFGFFEDNDEVNLILSQLNGKKYLIQGNHDRFIRDKNKNYHFEWIKDYYRLKWNKQIFILSHYPMYEWDGFFRGSIMLHGHIHTNNKDKKQLTDKLGKIYDVGVDANDYKPISAEEILNKFKDI